MYTLKNYVAIRNHHEDDEFNFRIIYIFLVCNGNAVSCNIISYTVYIIIISTGVLLHTSSTAAQSSRMEIDFFLFLWSIIPRLFCSGDSTRRITKNLKPNA